MCFGHHGRLPGGGGIRALKNRKDMIICVYSHEGGVSVVGKGEVL